MVPVPSRRPALPLRLGVAVLLILLGAWAGVAAASGEPPLRLKVVGGLANVSQYVAHEEPFWRRRVGEITHGRVVAEIAPFDRSGIRGQEMLQLMRLGVVPFGTIILAIAATEEPEFNAVDLPALAPDIATLRRAVDAFRPHLEEAMRDRYRIEVLGIYTYPAQVLFCRRPFASLNDLAGRRIRTSSVAQSDMVEALGAEPVLVPFAELVPAFRTGAMDCAITGTASGLAIGLNELTSHVHAMTITWGISVFGANGAAWAALPVDIQTALRGGVRDLEREIWATAERETTEGLACAVGQAPCAAARRGTMTLVPSSTADEERRRRLLTEVVLPRWIGRCGPDCAEAWNSTLAPALRLPKQPD